MWENKRQTEYMLGETRSNVEASALEGLRNAKMKREHHEKRNIWKTEVQGDANRCSRCR
jgi:hypothetical protein